MSLRWRGWRTVTADLGDDAARVVTHDDDAVGHQDRLLDVVGDHEDGLRRYGLVQPELHQLTAQRFGGENVERGERLVETEQLGLDRHRAGEPDLLPHAARELARVRRLEAVQTDGVDEPERLARAARPAALPRAFSATSTFSWTVSHG